MSKLSDMRKKLNKKGIMTEMNDPTEWISTGNLALNYRLSGRFDVGICNRRSFLYWGESGSGKTFLASSACKSAQDKGYLIIYIDTEESISEEYMTKIGIDMSEDKFMPVEVSTIEELTEATSEIFTVMDEDSKFIVVVDSLAGLLSEKEADDFDKGIQKGDQGQFSKKLKLFIKNFNRHISKFDAFGLLVTHAYANQKFPLEGTSKWICSGGHGFQFFPSFSVMLEKGKMKDKSLNGVRVKGEVTKTRFAPPFQKIELNVPYDKGIDLYEGFLEILVENKIIEKNGGWYRYQKGGEELKFQEKNIDTHIDNILELVESYDIENMELTEAED